MNKETQQKLLNIVKQNYNEIATNFSQTREKKAWPGVAELVATVPSGASILDVGCGNGRLSEIIPQNTRYTGSDSSKELIKIAQTKYPDKKFLVANMLDLSPLENQAFDFVFCIAAIHHIPGKNLQILALQELIKHTNPNGKIIITAWNLWNNKKFCPLIWKSAWQKIIGKNKMDFGDLLFDWKNKNGEAVSQRYYHAFTKKGLEKIIKQSGLKIEKQFHDKYNYYFILNT